MAIGWLQAINVLDLGSILSHPLGIAKRIRYACRGGDPLSD